MGELDCEKLIYNWVWGIVLRGGCWYFFFVGYGSVD